MHYSGIVETLQSLTEFSCNNSDVPLSKLIVRGTHLTFAISNIQRISDQMIQNKRYTTKAVRIDFLWSTVNLQHQRIHGHLLFASSTSHSCGRVADELSTGATRQMTEMRVLKSSQWVDPSGGHETTKQDSPRFSRFHQDSTRKQATAGNGPVALRSSDSGWALLIPVPGAEF
jgi:hypothetical protein